MSSERPIPVAVLSAWVEQAFVRAGLAPADATIAAEVERRFEAFKAGREKGLSHDEVFAAAKVLAA
jgi:hypothetical protein